MKFLRILLNGYALFTVRQRRVCGANYSETFTDVRPSRRIGRRVVISRTLRAGTCAAQSVSGRKTAFPVTFRIAADAKKRRTAEFANRLAYAHRGAASLRIGRPSACRAEHADPRAVERAGRGYYDGRYAGRGYSGGGDYGYGRGSHGGGYSGYGRGLHGGGNCYDGSCW